MSTKNENDIFYIDQLLIEIVNTEHPKTVKQLIKSVQCKSDLSEKQIFERISFLEDCEKLNLKNNLSESLTLKDYLRSGQAYWYIMTIALVGTTIALILVDLENVPFIGSFLVYARYVLGIFFVLFLPGYSLFKSLFPGKENDPFELVALSVGLSLIIIAINALILNFTPMGISTISVTLTILAITVLLSTIAVTREYKISNVK